VSGAVEWSRVKALFERSCDEPQAERLAWLRRASAGDKALYAEVASLLRAQSGPSDEFLSGGGERLAASLFGDTDDSREQQVGDRVGAYRLVDLLGEGGMGRVFLAERDDGEFEQSVALKLIRGEFTTREVRHRFLRERDILARLTHPNIAQLHDGGVADDGTPYFTLEYVEGEPITRWCDARNADVRARLKLFVDACDAVQYAHRNLVVHRDLKPSNILVTSDGQPKLVDFGIAKLLDTGEAAGTATHSRPMTREYAAPEQVLGEPITTATDVYALGVLLYELLCGHLPYARAEEGEIGWSKAIVDDAPESMSRAVLRGASVDSANDIARRRGTTVKLLRRALRGDLDRIAARALEKTPEARYASITAFAADIRAHLEGRALPGGSRRYRFWKFVGRNRVAVGLASALSLIVLTSLAVITVQSRRVAMHAQEALRQAQTTAAVKDFLLDLFHKADPNVAKGKEITARELVDRGVQRLDKLAPEQAALKAELQVTLGTIYFQLGLNKPAADLHERAVTALKQIGGDPLLTVTAERDWATELMHLNKIAQARDLADDALQRIDAIPDAPIANRVMALYTVGWIAETERNGERAVRAANDAIALARRPNVDEKVLAMALNLAGNSYWTVHDSERALKNYREALDIHRRVLGDADLMTLNDEEGIAASLLNEGRYSEAADYFHRIYDGFFGIYGPNNLHTLNASQGLALAEYESGKYAEARAEFERILAALQANPIQNAAFPYEIMMNYGLVLADLGDLQNAEKNIDTAHAALTEKMGATFAGTTEALADLGYVHSLQDKLDVAEQELKQAIASKTESKDDDTSTELAWLSDVERRRGSIDEARSLAQHAHDQAIGLYGERSRQAARAHYALAMALLDAHENDRAQTELRASLDSFKQIAPPDGMHPLSSGPRLELGRLLAADSAHAAEAAQLLESAVRLRTSTYGAQHPLTLQARDALAKITANR
jgi:serine/threonine protein kinase/tetratricopeptide (TPR) repeat protein